MNSEEMVKKQQYQLLLKQMRTLEKKMDELEDHYQMTRSNVEKSVMIDHHIGYEKEFETIQNIQKSLRQRLVYEMIPMISKRI